MRHPAVLGVFDGAVSCVGVLAGLLTAGASSATIMAVTAGLAVAAAVGMAAGDWLAGSGARSAATMGVATLTGSILPAIPAAILPHPYGAGSAAAVVMGVGAWIAETRAPELGYTRAYLTTAAVLLAAAVLSIAVTLLLGAAG